jgi:hypothetical protein
LAVFWLPADLERSEDSIHSHSAMLKKLVWFSEVGRPLMMAVPDLVVIKWDQYFLEHSCLDEARRSD